MSPIWYSYFSNGQLIALDDGMSSLPSCSWLRQNLLYNFRFNLFKQRTLISKSLKHSRKVHSPFHSQLCIHSKPETNSNPVLFSLISILNSCSTLNVCQTIHAITIKSLNYNDAFIGDRLVSVYVKLESYGCAQKLFAEIPEKDLVSWNSFISAFSRNGDVGSSLIAFLRLKSETRLKPNEVTVLSIISACENVDQGSYIHCIATKMNLLFETKLVNCLINMYGKFGCLASACALFEGCVEPNLVSWNSIMKIYVENGLAKETFCGFSSMRMAGVIPDRATMLTLLQSCTIIGVGRLADSIHAYFFILGLDKDIFVMTALLNVYSRLGKLSVSCDVFKEMKDPDSICWTAMIAAYAVHGLGRDAISFFNRMVQKGHKPDHVTFTHLLSACSHSGLVEEGNLYFEIMYARYKVKPRLEHYSCMVDLMGRSGRLCEAHNLIKSMPMEPNSGVWGALLNACRVYNNIDLGKEVAERLIALNPSDSTNYIMLSGIYSKAGQWKNVSKTRALMKERGLIRTPGCSFIEHGQKIHRFVVGDRLHPATERIYLKLEDVIKKIKKAGYVPNAEFVVHDVDDTVKEDMISKHSEKLAIAFGLLVLGPGMPIIITKNLRICGDCHSMAKFVSLSEKRMIIIRDARRFHHFANGLCSCGDYW